MLYQTVLQRRLTHCGRCRLPYRLKWDSLPRQFSSRNHYVRSSVPEKKEFVPYVLRGLPRLKETVVQCQINCFAEALRCIFRLDNSRSASRFHWKHRPLK